MRKQETINSDWRFTRRPIDLRKKELFDGEDVNLPHTWNALDGQDGGNDYHRGTCYYAKPLGEIVSGAGRQVYAQFEGVNACAEIYLNGQRLACQSVPHRS